MARSGVRYEDVQRAIDDLLARGESPSVQKVREVLGTGSFTTISEHLRHWRTRREENRDLPPPRGMPEALQELAEALWDRAQEAAGEALAHYREEANRQVEAARDEVGEARRQAEDAEQRESALAAHLSSTEQRLQQCSAESARMESAAQNLEQQLEKERQRAVQFEDQLARLQQDKERQASQYQASLAKQEEEQRERLHQEEQRHEAAEARLMAMLDDARQERQALEKAHAQRLKQAEHRQDALQQQLQSARGDLADEEKRHRETLTARSRAEENARARGHEVDLLNERVEEQRRLMAVQTDRLNVLEARLDEKLWTLTGNSPQDQDDDGKDNHARDESR